jgi:chitinase
MNGRRPTRRRRVLLVLALLVGLVAAGALGVRWWSMLTADSIPSPWFAGYVDVTTSPAYAFEKPRTAAQRDVVLSFIVAGRSSGCTPTWAGTYGLDAASKQFDLDRRIARLRRRGGAVTVSFGGQVNQELAVTCSDQAALTAAYRSVISRYRLDTIDLDLEGEGLTDRGAAIRRAKAIAALQAERRAAGASLAVWLTLPVSPEGLTDDGARAVDAMLDAHVDLAGVNGMTMNYGPSLPAGTSLLRGSELALLSMHRQLGVLYAQHHMHLGADRLWSKVGATPMVGQNDLPGEVFHLSDARGLNDFARRHGLGRVSMWSLNRDATCNSSEVDVRVASVACSGVEQFRERFADLLGSGIHGRLPAAAGHVTVADPTPTPTPDDPRTSPYPVWSQHAVYLKGTKVVWHRQVFEAKWWTRGDVPGAPVLHPWQTPWRSVRPVQDPLPTPAGTP